MLKKLQSEGYDTTVYTFGPGTTFGDHSHSVDKKDAILGGQFLFRMGGEEVGYVPCHFPFSLRVSSYKLYRHQKAF